MLWTISTLPLTIQQCKHGCSSASEPKKPSALARAQVGDAGAGATGLAAKPAANCRHVTARKLPQDLVWVPPACRCAAILQTCTCRACGDRDICHLPLVRGQSVFEGPGLDGPRLASAIHRAVTIKSLRSWPLRRSQHSWRPPRSRGPGEPKPSTLPPVHRSNVGTGRLQCPKAGLIVGLVLVSNAASAGSKQKKRDIATAGQQGSRAAGPH